MRRRNMILLSVTSTIFHSLFDTLRYVFSTTTSLCNFFVSGRRVIVAFYRIASRRLTGLLGLLERKLLQRFLIKSHNIG